MMSSLYHLGRMRNYRGGGYSDSTTIGKYKVQFDEDEYDLRVLIWNPDRPCLNIVLSKDDKIAVLDSIEYDPRCVVEGNMKRGTETRDMMNFAFQLMKENGATTVQLTDKSTVLCNGKKIKLGLMYFFKYGKTWYETYFGFYPIKHQERYEKAKEIQKTLNLKDKPCEYFTDDVLQDLIDQTKFSFLTDISWEKKL